MRHDVRIYYGQLVDQSHSGHPTVIEHIVTGNRDCPRIVIDPEFLGFAYQHRSTAGIARFLGVGTSTVRNALLEYGITAPGQNPFPPDDNLMPIPAELNFPDELFSDLPLPTVENLPEALRRIPTQTSSNISGINDAELDSVILRLRVYYRRVGITMVDGMLRRLGYRVPDGRIRDALHRVDPVRRVFDRIHIRRRVYSVPGPNALWHHDGQHGASEANETIFVLIASCRSDSLRHCNSWFY